MPGQRRAFHPHGKRADARHHVERLAVVLRQAVRLLALHQMQEAAHQLFRFGPCAALEHVGHQRGGGLADGAALAFESDVGDAAILAQLQIDGHAVAAERIVALGLVAGAFQHAKMARMARMIEDHLLVKFLAAHHP